MAPENCLTRKQSKGSERVTSDQPDAQDLAEALRQEMVRRYEATIILLLWSLRP